MVPERPECLGLMNFIEYQYFMGASSSLIQVQKINEKRKSFTQLVDKMLMENIHNIYICDIILWVKKDYRSFRSQAMTYIVCLNCTWTIEHHFML